jgi:hypothetical protein
MNELTRIFLTSGLTILGGVIVFVAGQIAVKFLIEPIQNYRELVGKIASALIYYANVGPGLQDAYLASLDGLGEPERPSEQLRKQRLQEVILNDWSKIDEAKVAFRKYASELMETTNKIPLFSLLAILRIVPKRQSILKASTHLIGLSNDSRSVGDKNRESEISKLLKIKVLTERFGN